MDRLTLAEIAVLCEPDDKPGENLPSPADLQAYFEWWHGMTPEEQLFAEEY